jgi:hypothetical protein
METLSLQNLCRFQTMRGEQNLRPSRRHELRKPYTLEAFAEEEAEKEDDEAVDRQLQTMNQKLLILQKEKKRFTSQLEAKRKASEKLENLN